MLDARKDIIDFFEKGTFPYKGNVFKTKEKEESAEEELEENKFFKYIENESKIINYDLFKKLFNFAVTSALVKRLYETKYKKNNELVNVIKSGLRDLKD